MTSDLVRVSAALEAEWEELAGRLEAAPFARPGWFLAWHRAFGRGDLHALTVRSEGRLAALLPLELRPAGLVAPANWHTPETTLLAEDPAALAALADAAATLPARRVAASFVTRPSASLAALEAAARRNGRPTASRLLERSPYLTIGGDWERYVAGLDRHGVAERRRRRRRLAERGALEFCVAGGGERLGGLLAEAFAIEASGWKGERGTAIVSEETTRRFYEDVAAWAAPRGWLRLAFLRLDDRALAFQYLLESGGVVYFLKGGYDEAFRRFSPGLLLVEDVLRWAFARGASSFEFLGDADPFKLEWTATVRERVAVEIFARSATGVGSWAATRFARPIAKRALAVARR